MKKLFLIFSAHLFLLSCGSSKPFDRGENTLNVLQNNTPTTGSTPQDNPPTAVLDKNMFEKSVTPILEASCTPCHSNPAPTFEAAKNLVILGNPAESIMVLKAQGLSNHMEILTSDSAELGVIKAWIMGGTLNE